MNPLRRVAPIVRRMVVVVLVVFAAGSGGGATEVDGRPNNPYGVMLGMSAGTFSDFASLHWGAAAEVTGPWGYVRTESGVHQDDPEIALRAIVFSRANRLIPILTGLYVPGEYRIPGGRDGAPEVRDDGYPLAAERYRRWAAGLAARGAIAPWYEVGNEVNGKWDPEAYGRYLIAVGEAMRSELPGLRILAAGLAGNGAEFIDELLTAVPEVADHVDAWGLHPYGINHPPAYEKDGHCLKGHLWTAEALARHGIDEPRFVMTETNYEVGNWQDARYPRITDDLRARYMVEGYRTIWEPDPRVLGVCYFFLQSVTYPGWDNDVLIHADGTRTRTFDALAATPKPPGSDWMPTGRGRIRGRAKDAATGASVANVFVWTEPGIYAAETDADGRFEIDGVPAGEYRVHALRDGWDPSGPAACAVQEGATEAIECSFAMARDGLLPPDLAGPGPIADGWDPTHSDPADGCAIDAEIGHATPGSQRLEARAGSSVGLWKCAGYNTAFPGRYHVAEIRVRGRGVRRGDGRGVVLRLSATDPYASPLAEAENVLPLEGDFDWTLVRVVCPPHPVARRLRIDCLFEAEEGTVWLDDPRIDEALGAAGEAAGPVATGRITGEVIAVTDARLPGAVVMVNPGNRWAAARSDGVYEIAGVPPGRYRIHAVATGWVPSDPVEVEVTVGAEVERDLVLARPPAPAELRNPGFEATTEGSSRVDGWTRYAEFDGVAPAGWHPELPEHPDGVQPRTGRMFAGSIAGYQTKSGGIRQVLEVEPGRRYRATVWAYTYRTDEAVPGDGACRLGLDPLGGGDPDGPYVLWTTRRDTGGAWERIELEAEAIADRMTVFLDVRHVQGRQFLLNVFDDAEFGPATDAPVR